MKVAFLSSPPSLLIKAVVCLFCGQCEELRLEQCKMSREKELIENQLEAEQEYIVNKLQKQAMGLAAEKQALQHEKAELKRQVLYSASPSLIYLMPLSALCDSANVVVLIPAACSAVQEVALLTCQTFDS